MDETTQRTALSVQKGEEASVGRSSDDSSTFSGGVIAGILVGAIAGICFCCCCLVLLGKAL